MVMFAKAVIVLFLLAIFVSLGSALYFLVTHKGASTNMVKALTWRIGLSLVLFVSLIIAFRMGWITPHPIGG